MFKPDGQPFKQVRFTSQSSSCWQATCVSIQGGSAGAVILTDLSGIPHAPSNWNHQSSPIWNHHQPNTTIKRTCSLKNHWWWLEIVMFFWGDIFVNIYISIYSIYIYIYLYMCIYIYIMYMCIYIYYVYVYIYIYYVYVYIYISKWPRKRSSPAWIFEKNQHLRFPGPRGISTAFTGHWNSTRLQLLTA